MKTWGTKDLVCATNADWTETLTLGVEPRAWVLAGATAIGMQIRSEPDGADPLVTLGLGSGLAIANAAQFTITLTVPASTIAGWPDGGWVYDIVVTTASGQKVRALAGNVIVNLGITRA